MIDTHCHLTYDPLSENLDQVLTAAREAGVDRMITVGTSTTDARKAAALAHRYEHIYATVGVHPHYADPAANRSDIQETIRELMRDDNVVAIGEMGLDLHYDDPPLESQQRVLGWQLEVAAECEKPIVIHNRKATDLILPILRDSGIAPGRFVFHCFTGERDELDAILQFGAMVGFTGITTFKNARAIAQCAAAVPDDRLLIETDSPYLTPEPHRKVRPNEPKYLPHVARFIAQERQADLSDFLAMVDANAMRFFALPAKGA